VLTPQVPGSLPITVIAGAEVIDLKDKLKKYSSQTTVMDRTENINRHGV
jgi:hypothetical protein